MDLVRGFQLLSEELQRFRASALGNHVGDVGVEKIQTPLLLQAQQFGPYLLSPLQISLEGSFLCFERDTLGCSHCTPSKAPSAGVLVPTKIWLRPSCGSGCLSYFGDA